MSIRSQDLLVAIKLALADRLSYPNLAAALGLSLSEAHAAVKRAMNAGLVNAERRANRAALFDFIVSGLKHAFVPKRGPLTRGMPTAHGGPPLDRLIGLGAEPPPVWPDPEGTVRGESFSPLYRSVPYAAKKDPKLYEALCLVDAIRGGRPRDRALATEHLQKLLQPAGDGRPASSAQFSLKDPRRRRIFQALANLVGQGTAAFYKSALDLLTLEPPISAASHLVAHLATEIESSIRTDVIPEIMAVSPLDPSKPTKSRGQSKSRRDSSTEETDGHIRSIDNTLTWLEIPVDGRIGTNWRAMAGQKNENGFAERRHRDALNPPRPVDFDLWLRWEEIIEAVLDAFEAKYLTVFQKLDELLATHSPGKQHAEALRKHLPQTDVARQYFFAKLDDPAWIVPLDEVGFFSQPPEPVREGDAVTHPSWPQLGYLARMAARAPGDVARIALAVPATENFQIIAGLMGIAVALPSQNAAPFAARLDAWLAAEASRPAGTGLASKAVELVKKLADDEESRPAAIAAIRVLLRPLPPPEGRRPFDRDPVARFSEWDMRHAMGDMSQTIRLLGQPALTMLAGLLEEAITMRHRHTDEAWADSSWIWRPAIEDHVSNRDDDLMSHLITATRDAAVHLIQSMPGQLFEAVRRFEARRWTIFRRLALDLLERFGSQDLDLVAARILDRRNLDSGELDHEYARLLRASFPRLTARRQEEFLTLIDAGPAKFASVMKDDLTTADKWRLQWLAVIAPDLPPSWRRRLEKLMDRFGEPLAPDLVPQYEFGHRPPALISQEDMNRMTPRQMVDAVTSRPKTFQWDEHDLDRSIPNAIAQNASTYAAEANALEQLDPAFVWSVFHGFQEALLAGHSFDWDPVVGLCIWATSHPRKAARRGTDNPDKNGHWQSARQAALRLLSAGMTRHNVPIPIALRDRVWSAIAPTLDDPHNGNEIGDRYADPLGQALNRVRGTALDTAVDYAFWVCRSTGSRMLADEARRALEARLGDFSVCVRAVFGHRIATLVHIDAAWCKANAQSMFAADQQGRDIAWETYLTWEGLNLDVFDLLRWRYVTAISELQPAIRLAGHDKKVVECLANDLARLYWHGRITFGDRESLLDDFFTLAPPSVTGHLIESIGHWLCQDEPPSPDALGRLKALWNRRAAVGRNEELVAFSWWFSSSRFEVKWALDSFVATLEAGCAPQYAPGLGEQLVQLIPQHLPDVLSCLGLLLKSDATGWQLLQLRGPARTILTAALATDDATLCRKAQEIIGHLAAAGHLDDFRDLVPGPGP